MRKLIIMALLAVTGSSLFTSCLKDEPLIDYTNIGPIIVVPNGNWPKTSAIATTTIDWLSSTPTPYVVNLYTHVSWDRTLDKDVEVTFALNPTAISEYNAAIKPVVAWTPLNTDAYTMPSMKVTIKAGTSDAYIPITIDPSKVDVTKHNMLAFSIVSAGDQTFSSNFKTYLFPLLVRNKFDATYAVTPFASPGFTDVTDVITKTYTAFATRDYHLVTLGPNKNVLFDAAADVLAYTHSYNTGTTATPVTGKYAAFAPVFTFELPEPVPSPAVYPSTHKVLSVTNYYTAAGSSTAKLDATGTSAQQYITITTNTNRVMNVKYNMTNSTTGAVQATFNEKFTYKAVRP